MRRGEVLVGLALLLATPGLTGCTYLPSIKSARAQGDSLAVVVDRGSHQTPSLEVFLIGVPEGVALPETRGPAEIAQFRSGLRERGLSILSSVAMDHPGNQRETLLVPMPAEVFGRYVLVASNGKDWLYGYRDVTKLVKHWRAHQN